MKSINYLKFTLIMYIFYISVISPLFAAERIIDIDEFNFAESAVKRGIRVCVFDPKAQKFEAINYHVFPSSTASRKPLGEINLAAYYGISIGYNCDVTIMSTSTSHQLSIRTKGKILGSKKKTVDILKDEVGSELLLANNKFVLGAKLKGKFNNSFSTNPYVIIEFKICFFEGSEKVRDEYFSSISSVKQEKDSERGKIGELATRLTMFFYGSRVKFSSQDGSNKGMDGVYLLGTEGQDEENSLFFTESKCSDVSCTPTKVMKKQLTEEVIAQKIEKLKDEDKERVFQFIDRHPDRVFKAVQRVLKNGASQWLVESFHYVTYQAARISSASAYADKAVLFKKLRPKFKSESEMVQCMLSHSNLTDSEKLELLLQTTSFPKDKKEAVKELLHPKVRKKLSFKEDDETTSGSLTEQEEEIENKDSQDEKPEVKKRQAAVDNKYNRENLAKLLNHIKLNRSWEEIVNDLQSKNQELKRHYQRKPNLSKFLKPTKYPKHLINTDHEDFWNLLKEAYPSSYKVAFHITT